MVNKSYFRIKEEEILKEVDLLKSVKHPTTKGGHLEELILRFLKEELPKQYSIDSGFIIGLLKWKNTPGYADDKKGKWRSKEMDVVIFDEQRNVSPLKLLRKKDFYVEGVYGVISIKSRLNKESFLDDPTNMLRNLISAKGIKTSSLSYKVSNGRETFDVVGSQVPFPILSVGFAYSGVQLPTIKKYLENEAKKYNRWYEIFPDIIAVLGQGLVYMQDDHSPFGEAKGYQIFEAPDNTLEEFFIRFLRLLNNTPQDLIAGLAAYKDFYND